MGNAGYCNYQEQSDHEAMQRNPIGFVGSR